MNQSAITETYLLSPMQEGMVFHTVYDPTAGFYIQQMVCTLREELNVPLLNEAWQRVVERHEILRTCFRWDTELPIQQIHREATVPINEEDWRDTTADEQTKRLSHFLEADRRRGFALCEVPLMRLALFRLGNADYRLVWTFHHALLDGRSHHLVLKEVFKLYEGYCRGQKVELKEPRPYRDYLQWLSHRDSSKDEEFWRRRLEGLTALAPLDLEGGAVGQQLHGVHEVHLEESTTSALKSLGERHALTLNTLVQGAWALLLSHYSGCSDVVFGATRACRRSTLERADEMVGMFINTLPVRLRVLPSSSLIQWLKELRQQNIEVRDYEHTPLLAIQGWSELPKGTPLFESIVVYENYEFNDSLKAVAGGWKNREFKLEEKINYPLVVAAYAGTELVIKIQYDRSRFADRAIEQLLNRLQRLLATFLSAPAENLSCDDIMRYVVNSPHEQLHASTAEQDDRENDVYVFPASFGQQRLWFFNQLEPTSSFYNIPLVARIKGPLKHDVLRLAVNEIVRRHETLRTTFAIENGQLLQLIAPVAELPVPLVDLTETVEDERELIAARLAETEANAPFDLSQGPVLRVVLVKQRPDEHLLLLTMHHICSDGWSMGVFLNELAQIYGAFLVGQPAPLAAPPIQYADFAQWQRTLLEGEFLEEQLGYWRNQLAGVPPLLELHTDRPRSPVQAFRGSRRSLELPEELRVELSDLSQREGVTMFMTFLAAFQTLLYRYTGREDIVVGSPTANRNRSEIENLIGLFVNTLVLRTDFSGNPSFLELLRRVRQVALGAYAHQDVPFDKVVDEINPERSLSYGPLVQVFFAFEKSWDFGPKLGDVDISWQEVERGTSKFDLALFVYERPAGLSCLIEYNTDLFSEHTIKQMLDHFQTLLEGITRNPERRVGELPLLTEAKRKQILDWNNTERSLDATQCIHQLFESEVDLTPDSVAVRYDLKDLTYGELNRRANQLAHYLQKRGVGPEELVGVCVERSLEMVVALLGILKAGGAYVPLDPAYPGERLALLLADAGVRIVLTQAALSHKFFDHNVELLLLDKDSQAWAAAAEENPENLCTPENLAYVMYTSGSTGIPKGVSITHRAVVRLVKETNYAHFDREQVFLQFAPLSFDASTFEIWGSLLNGARLAVMPPGSASLAELGTALRRYGVTTLWLTAGLFHQMVEEEWENLGGLRQLLAGGDVLSPAHVARVAHELNHCQLINGYGPTENTTFTCCYAVAADEKFAGTVPIGFPIANTQVFILDEALQPLPDGQPGELYIAGAGLARGYLNHPALTAERFVPHPFSSAPGARLYRSGDSARRLADGRIDFLGRLDQQVKIRGYRIELGEIEAVLRKHSSVRDVAVVAGQGKLIAYIVLSAKPIETGRLWTDLRDFMRSKLPEYMLPAIFIELPALPLTTSGKVDRRALPAPDETRPDLEQVYVAPRTEAETTMARIWSELLGLEKIGVYDNFFELGGHSMLATQVVSRVFDTFQVRLSLRSFFDSPTVAALAELVAGAAKENVGATPSIRRLQRGEPPISPT